MAPIVTAIPVLSLPVLGSDGTGPVGPPWPVTVVVVVVVVGPP